MLEPFTNPENQPNCAIAFVDATVPDYQNLIAGITPNTQVVILDPQQDGVEQISQFLGNNTDISSIHIISHGSAGSLQLGASYLSLNNLSNYTDKLQDWANSLTPDADILLYGCDVAAGNIGSNFVQQLSQLTNADVAASDDLTGSSVFNGDWELEVQTGTIEAPLVFNSQIMQTYNSVFASVNQIGQADIAWNYDYSGTRVGGISGITYDPVKNQFYAISDDKFTTRFYTLNIDLSSGSLSNSGVTFTGLTTLKDANGTQFGDYTSDPEGISFTNDGNVYIASEGLFDIQQQQFLDRFNAATGNRNRSLSIDNKFAVSPGDSNNGIRNNRGFESITVTPDGKYLFTTTEVPLEQDSASTSGGPSRIVKYNLSTGAAEAEYVYNSDSGNGVSDLLAVDENTLLAIDRNLSFGFGKLYQVSLSGATNVQSYSSINGVGGITSVQKSLLTDLSGIGFATNFEGLTFGPTLANGKLSLVLVADNNFGSAGFLNEIPTKFAAFEFTPDTPSFTVTNTNDTGIGSLRQAIFNANNTPGTNAIDFKISTTDSGYNPSTGAFTIKAKSALPTITDAVIIDGTTQTGFTNKPIIELDGSNAGSGVDGLKITAGNSTVKGLVINRFNGDGIELSSGGNNVIAGNYIGTDVNGNGNSGNSVGVYVNNTSNNRIGGTQTSDRNLISGNNGSGINIVGNTATGNRILSNSIFANNGLGINLGTDGVTANDAGDGDTGANNLQNFPILTAVNGSTITGTLNSTPNKNFRIEFFASSTQDSSGYGEGEVFLDSQIVTTNASGDTSFNLNFTPNPAKPFITATATLLDGANNPVETSEFSRTPVGVVEFTAANYSAMEGSSGNSVDKVIAKVKRTGGSAGAVSVPVMLSATPGSATSPEDFNQLPAIVTFNDGETGEKEVIIPIVEDTLVEDPETINLQLGTPDGAVLGIQTTATFTIENDDAAAAGTLQFSTNNYSISEGSTGGFGSADVVKISRTGGSTGAVSVQVRVSTASPGTAVGGSTATGDTDYDSTVFPITVNFADGEVEKAVLIPINRDTTAESDDTLSLEFVPNSATGGAAIGTQTTTILNILNDDGNSSPVLDLNGDASGTGYSATFNRGSGAVAIVDSNNLKITDDGNIASAKVTITNLLNGAAEVLTANTSNTNISASYNNGVLTLSGNDTVANYQKVLRTVSYNNSSVIPNTTNRAIDFVINDGITDSNIATTTLAVNFATTSIGNITNTTYRTPIASINDNQRDTIYSFNLTNNTRLVAELTNSGGNADLELYDFNGNLLRSSINGGTLSERIDYSTLSAGNYYLRVYQAFAGQSINYRLRLNAMNV